MLTLIEEKQRKSILYDITYMWNLKKMIRMNSFTKSKQIRRLSGKMGECQGPALGDPGWFEGETDRRGKVMYLEI